MTTKKPSTRRIPKTIKIPGFTLVELIVVITILAILATIGFLALSGYSQDAKDATVKANVRSVATAISSESAITNNSPRYYVVHDSSSTLANGSVAYVDGSPVTLTGGDWNVAGTNYSAGNPDWTKLKLNPEKFRLSSMESRLAAIFGSAGAAYDPTSISIGAMDASLAPTATGRNRATSFYQVTGIAPATGRVSISGNFPTPSASQISAGAVQGLVKGQGTSAALVDGEASSAQGQPATYPGCDTPDIVLSNGQRWAACNVGASKAWTGGVTISNCSGTSSDCASGMRNVLGGYYQWGRNDDVSPTGTPTTVRAATGTLSDGVGHSNYITPTSSSWDWLGAKNDNIWGGSGSNATSGTFASLGSPAAMKGPCAPGYHVPTRYEWWLAISSINPALTNTMTWQNDTSVASTLKLPRAGLRGGYSISTYTDQGVVGYYWASSISGSYGGSSLNINASQVYPAYDNLRGYGYSVRCIANN